MEEITKQLQFEKVEQKADAPSVYTFRASDGGYDRANDRIIPSGWKLDNYRANPVVLFNHNDGSRSLLSGPQFVLPVGKADVRLDNEALVADITFDPSDTYAKAIEAKVKSGFLNAVSVRFRPLETTDNERGGVDFLSAELLEISVVNLPCNPRATRLKSDDPDELEAFADLLIEKMIAKGVAVIGGPTVTAIGSDDAPSADNEEAKSVPESVSESASESVTDPPAESPADPVVEAKAVEPPGIDITKAASILADLLTKSLETQK